MFRLARYLIALSILFGSTYSPALAQDKSLTVFAAASMKNALDDISAAYTARTGVRVVASYAASSVLAKQIEQGAPADIFASADTDWMDYAIGKKTINEPTRVNLLGNSLVLIAAKDSRLDKVAIGPGFDLSKLAGDGRIATGDVKSVPVGQIRQDRAGKARRVAGGGTEIRHGGECARSTGAGGPRRGAARDRLFDRREN